MLRGVNKSWDERDRLRKPQLFLEPGHAPVEDFEAAPLTGCKGVGAPDVSYHLLERLAAAKSIRLLDGGKFVGEIALPGVERAMRSMRECNDTALEQYGVNPAH